MGSHSQAHDCIGAERKTSVTIVQIGFPKSWKPFELVGLGAFALAPQNHVRCSHPPLLRPTIVFPLNQTLKIRHSVQKCQSALLHPGKACDHQVPNEVS